ncbi:uncharacterized protein LOC135337464 [Halichondria panicea]|uniref:uncharacterized protein LOC135337464 n=1 Tax=Halichondria panicea TaxID=6063 RepID=UPI00312B7DBA
MHTVLVIHHPHHPHTPHTLDDEAKKVASQAQADARWIIRNTKPCPHCRAPIQKNDGCNHMTCKQCRHDFCWVCLDPWSLHNHRTGGYFTCNRFTAQEKANTTVEMSRGDMEAAYVKKATEDL